MRIKKTLIILAGLFILFAGVQTVFAQIADDPYGFKKTAGTAGLSTDEKTTVSSIAGNVIGAILTMVGVLFLVLMIYGGITWMLARGNEQQSQKALNTIIAAVIGLIIVLGSYAFTTFIFTSVQDKSTSAGGGSCFNIGPLPDPSCVAVECNNSYKTATDCAIDMCCEWQ